MPANRVRLQERHDTAAAVRYAGMTESEIRERIKELLSRCWAVERIAQLFGITPNQVLRLAARPHPERATQYGLQ
jgi:hypothetical protein